VSGHKNDMYGGDVRPRSETDDDVQPAIPAATVVLLRNAGDGIETLMLKKNSDIAFGGMWVFPGGRIDDADRMGAADDDAAARRAAVREAEEESGLAIDAGNLVWFSHWTPPPAPRKRFATWFFAGRADHAPDVVVDQGEITDHIWIRPEDALARHAAGEIDVVPPTWVTLHHLAQDVSEDAGSTQVDRLLSRLAAGAVKVYQTRVGKDSEGHRVAMWRGDAGYEPWDATTPGARHRLVMAADGFRFVNDVETY
jgi:8-oxo-dGTP pyrophosphatase MutT (NUDIX family)